MNTAKPPIRVLLADDHAVVRAGIRQFLEQADDIQVVAEAGDGEAAQARSAGKAGAGPSVPRRPGV